MTPAPGGGRMALLPMAAKHLEMVHQIERASFSRPWAKILFQAELINPQALPLAAVSLPSGRVAGYLILWLAADEVQVQNLAVDPARRGQGVGRMLLSHGLKQAYARGARTAQLEVRPSNLAARRLYASLGFVEQGRRKGYYQPEDEDAILLGARLDDLGL